jgi:DNA-binding MarR family transcriptional regulator
MSDLPVTPYPDPTGINTAGWSGSETSHEAALHAVVSGDDRRVQARALRMLAAAGPDGLTSKEFGIATGIHHGRSSGAMSVLHQAGLVARLRDRRGRYEIYVLPDEVRGRKVSTRRHNKPKSAADYKRGWDEGRAELLSILAGMSQEERDFIIERAAALHDSQPPLF